KAKVERKETIKQAEAQGEAQISPAASRLARRIAKAIKSSLPDLPEEPCVDPLSIRDMIEGAFWSGAKSRLFLLNEDESLVQFTQGDAWKFLCRRFGSPVDPDEILTTLSAALGGP